MGADIPAPDRDPPRRLYVYNGGFFTAPRIRRILHLAGWEVRLGAPGPGDRVGVWGRSPTAPRGEAVAGHTGAQILRVEDAFLRSVLTGREGAATIGLTLDTRGVHFDASVPSDLEVMLATHPLDDTGLLRRAGDGIALLRHLHLSKYNAFDPAAAVPDAPYVLVIDQTRADAAIRHGGAGAATFREMLAAAQQENPGTRVVIKGHPETAAGRRDGHFGPADTTGTTTWLPDPVSPWRLLDGATAVYTVSSQMGFEAILAGHRPHVFGRPFYAGWGLTEDRSPPPRRGRRLTPAQLFAAAMLLYPTWYDPCRDRLCSFEEAALALAAEARAWREDRAGWTACGMRAWKRRHLRAFFGDVRFARGLPPPGDGRRVMVWGRATPPVWPAHRPLVRVEDGVLRSKGLGADLVPPLSLTLDDLGLATDPARESRLERLIAASTDLPAGELRRAEWLIRRLAASGLSKYNLGGAPVPPLPAGRRILVAGQVEDDASVVLGAAGEVRGNAGLLARTRADNPGAVILWKPHPDVEAGLRPGALPEAEALRHADAVLAGVDAAAALAIADEVWTLTSGLGFEALLRGLPVTCLGAPFYAGWGLTRDVGPVPARRAARPGLAGLAHAVLIGYPRYRDPVSGRPCSVEVIVERLESGTLPPPPHRLLARLQGWFAGWPVWR